MSLIKLCISAPKASKAISHTLIVHSAVTLSWRFLKNLINALLI
jgi:hypothetical protein